jgi:hypothetical protein
VLRALRAAVALAIVFAIVFQFQHGVDTAFEAVNFFSFFTILSNTMAAALLAWETLRPPERHGAGAATVRGAVTLYMTITFVAYSVLLGPADIGGPEPWVNFVVHFLAPLAVLADWVLVPERALPGKAVVVAWLAWPLLWVVYTLIRGVREDWYPYPFLDPDESGGYAGVFGYAVAVFAAFVAVGLGLWWWASRLAEPCSDACIWFQALDCPRDRPVVIPAKRGPQDRREVSEQRSVRVHAPVEADTCAAVLRSERPYAAAR